MKASYLYVGLIIIIIGGLVMLRNTSSTERAERVTAYDGFAQCLTDSGAKFYGAYWCPHCQSQKRMFENSKKLPYIECSTPDGNSQLPVCNDADVTTYPTWIFADGSRLEGERSLSELGEKTNCTPPSTS